MEYAYYIAAGRSLEKIQAMITASEDARLKRKAYVKERGFEGLRVLNSFASNRVVGVIAKNSPGVGWRPLRGERDHWVPDRRTKASVGARQELAALAEKLVEFEDFGHVVRGRSLIVGPRIESVGEKYVLCVPIESKWTPPDAIPIKTSEYWAMKEALPQKA